MDRKLIAIVASVALLQTANAVTIYSYDNISTPDVLISFDSATPGTVTVIGASGLGDTIMSGLDFAGVGGGLYSWDQNSGALYSVNIGNGAATLIGGSGLAANEIILDLSWHDRSGQMLAIAFDVAGGSNSLYSVNLTSGAATLIGVLTGMSGATGIGLSTDASGTNYVHDITSDQMFVLSGLNGTPLGPLGYLTQFSQGMTIDWSASGVWYHGAIRNSPSIFAELYTINPATGAGSLVGTIGPGPLSYETGDIAITPVPEPASMIGLGIASLLGLARRRHRSK